MRLAPGHGRRRTSIALPSIYVLLLLLLLAACSQGDDESCLADLKLEKQRMIRRLNMLRAAHFATGAFSKNVSNPTVRKGTYYYDVTWDKRLHKAAKELVLRATANNPCAIIKNEKQGVFYDGYDNSSSTRFPAASLLLGGGLTKVVEAWWRAQGPYSGSDSRLKRPDLVAVGCFQHHAGLCRRTACFYGMDPASMIRPDGSRLVRDGPITGGEVAVEESQFIRHKGLVPYKCKPKGTSGPATQTPAPNPIPFSPSPSRTRTPSTGSPPHHLSTPYPASYWEELQKSAVGKPAASKVIVPVEIVATIAGIAAIGLGIWVAVGHFLLNKTAAASAVEAHCTTFDYLNLVNEMGAQAHDVYTL